MKKVSMLIAALAVVAVIALFLLGRVSGSGEAPGIVDGRLASCPDKPNCVCSEYRDDASHFIEPFELSGQSAENLLPALRAAITESGGVIRSDGADYIAATFTSPLFSFVDDLEVRVDTGAALVHFRSASRVGHGDLGVNRKRVEALKSRLRQNSD